MKLNAYEKYQLYSMKRSAVAEYEVNEVTVYAVNYPLALGVFSFVPQGK